MGDLRPVQSKRREEQLTPLRRLLDSRRPLHLCDIARTWLLVPFACAGEQAGVVVEATGCERRGMGAYRSHSVLD